MKEGRTMGLEEEVEVWGRGGKEEREAGEGKGRLKVAIL